MYGIDVLVQEHDHILRFTSVIRAYLMRALRGDFRVVGEVETMVDFIRNYADHHHHGKEEQILFHYMLEDLGEVAEKIVRQGMLVEHDQARNIVSELVVALACYKKEPREEHLLDILGGLYRYATLLEAHAERENAVVYPFAERHLSAERLREIDEKTRAFEREYSDRSRHYLHLLDGFETGLKIEKD